MLDPTAIVLEHFVERLTIGYRRTFGAAPPDLTEPMTVLARLAVERIAASDALYHDVRHTMLVTLVGQAILRGQLMLGPVSPDDWLHFTVATLLHDIGYVRGSCPGDRDGHCVIDQAGTMVEIPRGASDAFLTPYHVDRGKLFVHHRCASITGLDVERLCRAIELTRFPVPEDGDHAETGTEAGLVRAADLIGQLADPDYPRRLGALFAEFKETGIADRLGYTNPADLAEHYPQFFWGKVEPYLTHALEHLERTGQGRQWVAQLYAHILVEEHKRQRPGPARRSP